MRTEHQQSELIQFLQAENKSLREESKEFKDLAHLNRQALKIALITGEKEKQLPALVRLLFQENSKLLARCKTLKDQLQEKSCQVLISEQIASASNQHEKYVAAELKERLKILKKQIDMKHRKIEELTKCLGKVESTDYEGQQMETTVIEYTQINKVSEKMFKEVESLRRELQLKQQDIEKLKEQKQDLYRLNLILTKQVSELKAYSCQTTASIKREANTSSSDLSKFLKYQSKIAQNSDDGSQDHDGSHSEQQNSSDEEMSDSDIEQSPAIEQKVESIEKKKKFNLSLNLKKEEEPKVQKPVHAIPKLQLKKARQIQSLIIKKINNDQKKKTGVANKDQKFIKKFQLQLDQLRKKLGNQLIIKMRIQRQNSFLKKFISELQSRNELLVKQRQEKAFETDYEKQRMLHQEQNLETLLDICRDVTLNERLKSVCKGKETITKKIIYSKEI